MSTVSHEELTKAGAEILKESDKFSWKDQEIGTLALIHRSCFETGFVPKVLLVEKTDKYMIFFDFLARELTTYTISKMLDNVSTEVAVLRPRET